MPSSRASAHIDQVSAAVGDNERDQLRERRAEHDKDEDDDDQRLIALVLVTRAVDRSGVGQQPLPADALAVEELDAGLGQRVVAEHEQADKRPEHASVSINESERARACRK